jgi:hypothetical protein
LPKIAADTLDSIAEMMTMPLSHVSRCKREADATILNIQLSMQVAIVFRHLA